MRRILFLCMFLLLAGCTAGSEPGGVGTPLVGVELQTPGGAKLHLGNLAGQGLVLNFWATWCGPCRDEMPSLERLHNSLDNNKYAVVGVSLDKDHNLVREFLLKHGITFPVALDPERRQATPLGVQALPVTLLIGPDGIIRERLTGERRWDDPALMARIRTLNP